MTKLFGKNLLELKGQVIWVLVYIEPNNFVLVIVLGQVADKGLLVCSWSRLILMLLNLTLQA